MGRSKARGRSSRKNRASLASAEEPQAGQPHTMVFTRAGVGKFVKQLATDLRLAFEPFTALRLRFGRSNVLKDAVAIAGKFSVTHLLYFTHPADSVNLRLVACPHGPTLTFRVSAYALRADVLSSLRTFSSSGAQFQQPPLLVMNGFTGDGQQLRLMTAAFRSLLPALDLQKLQLRSVRRCLLLNYDADSDTVQLRHYTVRLAPQGITKAVRKLRRKRLPNLARYADMHDFLANAGAASDSGLSDADLDGDHNVVDSLPQPVSNVHQKGCPTAVRLTELGPRITMQLIKVEDSVNSGRVLYHKFVTKTKKEEAELESRVRRRRRLSARRREEQQQRVAAKAEERLRHKRRCLEGMVAAGDITQQQADSLLREAAAEQDAEQDGEQDGEQPQPKRRRQLAKGEDAKPLAKPTAKVKPKPLGKAKGRGRVARKRL